MARLYFLAYFISTSCLVAGQSTRYVLKGVEVSLKPGITGPPENILWKHNGNKVVEFNGQEEDVYDSFTNRITLNWHTAELSITNLGFDDSGDYELEAYVNRKLYPSQFNLVVIEEVAKPSISCKITEDSSSNMSATLVCAAEPRQPQSLIKFEWSSHGNTQPGSKLTIPLEEENDDEDYTCTVSNPLSMETATFTAKDCYIDKPSSTALIVSLVILFIALLFVGLGIMYCKRHHKACFAKAERDDLEKQLKSGATEGSAEEKRSLLNTSSTLPSNQPLHQVTDMVSQDETPQKGHVKKMRRVFESPGAKQTPVKKLLKEKNKDKRGKTAPSPPSLRNESPSAPDQNKLAREEEGDADADQLGKQEEEVPQSMKEPDPAEELATSELNEEADEVLKAESPTNGISPAVQPPSSSTQTSSNMASGDTTGEHKEDTNSDPVSGDSERSCREPDSSDEDKTNISDGWRENEQSSTTPEQEVSDMTQQQQQDLKLPQEEPQTSEDNKQEMDKPEPGDMNTRINQEFPHAAQDDSDQEEEGKKRKDSEESGDSQSNQHEESATSPSQQKLNEEADDLLKAESPTNGISPAAQPPSSSTQTSSNMASVDTTGEHKEDTNSDPVSGDSERGCREPDSSDGDKTNISDGWRENEQSSTTPEQKDSDTTQQQQQDLKLPQEEPQRSEDNHQQMNKPVSAVENGSKSVDDSEEKDNQQKQDSPKPSEPDDMNTSIIQESPHATQDDSDQEEGKKKKGSEESGDGQSNRHEQGATSLSQQKLNEEADEVLKAESPTNGISPAVQPPSSSTQTSSNMASVDTTGEHKEDTNSDPVSGDSERGCKEPDSSDEDKTNISDGSRENEQSSTTPEQEVSDMTQQQQGSKSSQEELQTSEDNQQQMDKSVSAVENGSKSEDDSEEKDNQQKQDSPKPSEPGDMNTSIIQESPQATQEDSNEEESKKRKDSEESGVDQDGKHKGQHEQGATSPPSLQNSSDTTQDSPDQEEEGKTTKDSAGSGDDQGESVDKKNEAL